MQEAERMKKLPRYLFTVIDDMKAAALAKGIELIDLGMGNPDLPSPPHVVEELRRAALDPANHRYMRPDNPVEDRLREAAAGWYRRRFGVKLDPRTEVLPLVGSKEGISHFCLSVLDAGDTVITPAPSYPIHFNGALLAEAVPHTVLLRREKGYRMDLAEIPDRVARRAKMIVVNYPHNPTTGTVDVGFYRELVAWARKHDVVILSDIAYCEFVYEGEPAPSVLQVEGAKEIAVEFYTLSKTYNMCGWRVGFAVGNEELLKPLAKIKSYVDYGLFGGIKHASVAALNGPQDSVAKTREAYRRRRDVLIQGLNRLGWKVDPPGGTFYVWTSLPEKYRHLKSLEFTLLLLEKTGVVVSPGTGFGEAGEGFVRFALVDKEERIKEAVEKIGEIL